MATRPVPKLSGLIKSGAVVPASEEAAAGAPNFDFLNEPNSASTEAQDASETRTEASVTPLPSSASRVEEKSAAASANPAREIRKIPLSKLKIHPFNSRVVRPQERIEEVRDMLTAENKQREPITVVPGRRKEDLGHFYILSGQTRYHSANLAGWPELEAQINPDIDPDDHVAFWAASIEHNTSIRESDWDVAVQAKRLMDEGVSQELILKAARRDARGLRRLLSMIELPETVQAVVRENSMKLTAPFCEILRSGVDELGEEFIAELATVVVRDDMSQRALADKIERDIRRKAKASASGTKRATREFMLPVNVAGLDKKAGDFKVLQSRKEGNRVVTLTADLPEKFAEILKADIAASIAKFSGETSGA